MNDRHQYEKKNIKEDHNIGKSECLTSICEKIIKDDMSAHKKKPIISIELRMAWMLDKVRSCKLDISYQTFCNCVLAKGFENIIQNINNYKKLWENHKRGHKCSQKETNHLD